MLEGFVTLWMNKNSVHVHRVNFPMYAATCTVHTCFPLMDNSPDFDRQILTDGKMTDGKNGRQLARGTDRFWEKKWVSSYSWSGLCLKYVTGTDFLSCCLSWWWMNLTLGLLAPVGPANSMLTANSMAHGSLQQSKGWILAESLLQHWWLHEQGVNYDIIVAVFYVQADVLLVLCMTSL